MTGASHDGGMTRQRHDTAHEQGRDMSAFLWPAPGLAPLMAGEAPSPLGGAVTSVSIDTRTLQPGALFFAIRGGAQDGHAYLRQALQKGALAAVIERGRAEEFAGLPVVLVEDTLRALEALGRAGRARLRGRVIAVTGSVGKTSTKEMLRSVLTPQGMTHASIASYNNHWGVPLTLARTPEDSAFAIYEIGMSAPFEILPLTAMVRPEIAIVSTVEPVHLAHFPCVAAIADAKGEVFSGLEPGGVALINIDNPHGERLKTHAGASRAGRIVTFGTARQADLRLVSIELAPDFSLVEAEILGRRLSYRIGVAGRHFVMNSLAVLGAARLAGADLAQAAQALAAFGPVEGRGQRLARVIDAGSFTLIDESYNANPSSMRAALAVSGAIPRGAGGRRIAVLGDMLELGPQAARLHAGLGAAILDCDIDLVFAAGTMMRHLYEALPAQRRGAYAEDAASLAPQLAAALVPGDVVVIKGSNGSRMGDIVAALKARYPAAQTTARG